MNSNTRFESAMAAWFESEAPSVAPTGLVDGVLEFTARRGSLPRWRAMLEVPVVRGQAAVLVGSPGVRMARMVLAAALMLGLLVVAAVAGAKLLEDRPTVTPRSQLVVYVGQRPVGMFGNEQDALYATNPGSSEQPRLVYAGTGRAIVRPLISPDGLRVAFAEQFGGLGQPCSKVNVLDLASGEVRDVGAVPRNYESFEWSPTGNQLAMGAGCTEGPDHPPTGDDQAIVLFDLVDGSTRVVSMPRPPSDPVLDWGSASVHGWSPDGSSLLLSQVEFCAPGCDPGVRLYVVPIDGGVARPAIRDPDRTFGSDMNLGDLGVSWASDGSRLLLSPFGSEIRVIELDNLSQIELAGVSKAFAAWSPDGQKIAYIALATPSTMDGRVMVVTLDDPEPVVIGTAEGLDRYTDTLGWTPDGSAIWWSDGFGTWTVDLDGGEPVKVAPAHADLDWGLAAD